MSRASELLFEQIVERAHGNLHGVGFLRGIFLHTTPAPGALGGPRHYHDAGHLVDVWTSIPSHEPADAMFVLYHDYVWAAGAAPGRNEELSAEEFLRADLLVFPGLELLRREVHDGILATARHLEDQDDLTERQRGWLDGDLAGLASHPHAYSASTEAVRLETGLAKDDPRWVAARADFLDRMAARRQIYYLRESARLEHQARVNIREELRELRRRG